MTDREIFTRILEADSSHAREQVLSEACGNDAARRQRLEALLAEHQQLGQFLEVPPQVGEDSTLPIACPGTQLGRYRLVSLLGEGGMGEVWVAEQTEPVRRRVALKLIKPGLDSRRVLARFEAERQALALMDHAHIATIYDGGMTPAGRPYFVMELVSGIPITEYCELHRVPLTERISLLIAVCQAVQHAHQKGVIHRDLKPSNILVAEGDGQPVPKVIDFGLAKATDASQLDISWDTKHGQPLGTPLYMSPEQAERHNADIDVRSDVYSLGVVLYELLTGTTPLDRAQLQQAGEAEWLGGLPVDCPARELRALFPRPGTPGTRILESLPA